MLHITVIANEKGKKRKRENTGQGGVKKCGEKGDFRGLWRVGKKGKGTEMREMWKGRWSY